MSIIEDSSKDKNENQEEDRSKKSRKGNNEIQKEDKVLNSRQGKNLIEEKTQQTTDGVQGTYSLKKYTVSYQCSEKP